MHIANPTSRENRCFESAILHRIEQKCVDGAPIFAGKNSTESLKNLALAERFYYLPDT
jgi:hypothetical protein